MTPARKGKQQIDDPIKKPRLIMEKAPYEESYGLSFQIEEN